MRRPKPTTESNLFTDSATASSDCSTAGNPAIESTSPKPPTLLVPDWTPDTYVGDCIIWMRRRKGESVEFMASESASKDTLFFGRTFDDYQAIVAALQVYTVKGTAEAPS